MRIVDRYLRDTTLRLRRIEDEDGSVVYKLGQKVRPRAESPEIVRLTNLYLREDEYEMLRELPANELTKVRWHLPIAGHAFVIDEFEGALVGLVMAELELVPGEPRQPVPEGWEAVDVTDDDGYSGGRLAALAPGSLPDYPSSGRAG